MQDHYNSSQYKSAYTGMILPGFGEDTDYDTMFAQAEKKGPVISIKMQQASDNSGQQRRIGQKSEDEEESLNNESSRQYMEFMEKRCAAQDLSLTSNFGQNYMKQ